MTLQDVINQQQEINGLQIQAALGLPAQNPTEAQLAIWKILESHASRRGVRPFPASPALVADFLAQCSPEDLERVCEAIVAIHDSVGMANPVATYAVRVVLAKRLKVKPPNSWPAADRELFASLPPDIRAIIARRETERDRLLRQEHSRRERRRLTTKETS